MNIHVSTGPEKNDRLAPVTLSAKSYLHADKVHAILGDPGAVSRVDKIFVVNVYEDGCMLASEVFSGQHFTGFKNHNDTLLYKC